MLVASRATQLLADFLAVVSALPDTAAALDAGVEGAAKALDAQFAAVVSAGRARAWFGYPSGSDAPDVGGEPPPELLALVVSGEQTSIALPGVGECHAIAVSLAASLGAHLVIARCGAAAFSLEEINLARGMARVMELTFEMLRTLESERLLRDHSERQAAENARLLASLRERQRLLEELAGIERAISRREPLADILNAITRGLHDLLGDDVVVLRQADRSAPADQRIVAASGETDAVAQWLPRVPIPEQYTPGRAVEPQKTVQAYAFSTEPADALSATAVRAVMATPVHENGVIIGSLVVGSHDSTRRFSEADRATLLAFADHASLAVTDANTLQAMYRAFHDSLTGLASRALFLDRLQHGLAQAARANSNLTLLFIDLDRFKVVNDTLGHAAGDQLLIEVAVRLRSCLRATDTAARLGGDEFVVLLQGTRADDATIVADRIIQAVRAPITTAGVEVLVDASIGIAASQAGIVGADELLRNADVAMYRAKRAGRGRHATYEPRAGWPPQPSTGGFG